MKVNVAVIGRKGHAKKIIKILNNIKQIKKIGIFHPKIQKKEDNKFRFFNEFDEINNFDLVILSSPNYTHNFYLKKLINFKGNILCEKPAGSKNDKINCLKSYLRKKKINLEINYNLLNSELFKIIKKIINQKKFGKVIFFQIIKNTGLAFNKKKYLKNWRSNKKLSSGILELQTVHYINFFLNLFNNLKIHSFKNSKFSKYKNVNTDSTIVNLVSGDKYISIVNSYASTFNVSFNILLTNSKINYDGRYLKIFYPRDTFDINKRYTEPKIFYKKKIIFEKMWENSLITSLELFIKKNQKKLDKYRLKKSLETFNIFKKVNK